MLALSIVGLVALVLRLAARGRRPADEAALAARVEQLEIEHAALRRWLGGLAAEVGAMDGPTMPPFDEPARRLEPTTSLPDVALAVGEDDRDEPADDAPTSPSVAAAAPSTVVPPALSAPFPERGDTPAEAAEPPPRRGPSLEERLGARLPVWIGSIALALAGAFLVKYSLDQGWIGPRVRVLLALGFAALLVAVGERMRRSSASIAQGLTAAGVAVLFAALLAAVHLYALLSPLAGFLLMAAATAGAVALALRHGPMVAVIGLLGGLVTPHLVFATDPRPAHLFGYLLLLEGGLMAIDRRRGWRGLGLASLAGGLGWTLAWIAGGADGRGAALFLLASAVLAVAAGAESGEDDEKVRWHGPHAALSIAGLLGSLVVLVFLVARGGFPTEDWVYLGLLSAGILVLGRLADRFSRLPVLTALIVGVLLAGWLLAAGRDPAATLPFARYVATVAGFGVLFAGGSYAAQWGSRRPGSWGVLAAGAVLAAVLLVLAAGAVADRDGSEALLCLGVAVVVTGGAAPVLLRRRRDDRYGTSTEAFVGLAALLVALAAGFDLERGTLTVVWALMVPALVELARRLRLDAPWWLGAALAALVTARLLLRPDLHFPDGGWPILNRLLVDFGIPLAALAVAAWRAAGASDGSEGTEGRAGRDLTPLAGALSWAAALVAFLLVGLLVRHAFGSPAWPAPLGPPDLSTWTLGGHGQWGTLITAWLLLAGGLAWWGRRRRFEALTVAGAVCTIVTLAILAVGPVLVANPLFWRRPVGPTPVFNLLLVLYGLPASVLAVHAIAWSRAGWHALARTTGTAALVVLFLLVTLEVRQAFHGTLLAAGGIGHGEQYAYSAAWVLLATVLLVAGILRRRGGRPLRFAALAVTTVAVGKVFLYDTAHLSDLYRVLSFLGLGLSLLLLAWLYQRFVFADEPAARGAATPPPS